MKKMYILAASLFFGSFANAQWVVDFESNPLPSESYNNGSSGLGDFYYDNLVFNNAYDTSFGGIWSGFAISNMSDATTPGLLNQYSAYPGSGAGNSDHYAVAYYDPTITGNSAIIDSFRITNTTYAALSMRDGDDYGKVFGSIYNADGIIDGTEGKDFFRVWIVAKDLFSNQEDSIEFYLADYQYADDNLDYILDEWKTIDLSNFSFAVGSVRFRLESSDNAPWGMNTPAYFVVDDVFWQPFEGLDELNSLSVSTYPNPMTNELMVTGEEGTLTVSTIQGKVIYSNEHHSTSVLDCSNWAAGTYFVRVENEKGSALSKVVK